MNILELRGKHPVAFGPGLKPMSSSCLSNVDRRRAVFLMECGYKKLQLPSGEVVKLEELAR